MRQDTSDCVLEILKNAARGVSYYHLADKSGNMTGIESVYDDYTLFHPENHSLVHANHYETEKFKKNDLAYTYIQDSFGRADRFKELVEDSYGRITVEQIMKFLKDHRNYPDSICNHVDKIKPSEMATESRASIIMVPEREFHLRYLLLAKNLLQLPSRLRRTGEHGVRDNLSLFPGTHNGVMIKGSIGKQNKKTID